MLCPYRLCVHLTGFGIKELMNLGVIPKCHLIAKNKPSLVKNLLQFFGVASPEDWQKYYAGMEVAFRRVWGIYSNQTPDTPYPVFAQMWLSQSTILNTA